MSLHAIAQNLFFDRFVYHRDPFLSPTLPPCVLVMPVTSIAPVSACREVCGIVYCMTQKVRASYHAHAAATAQQRAISSHPPLVRLVPGVKFTVTNIELLQLCMYIDRHIGRNVSARSIL